MMIKQILKSGYARRRRLIISWVSEPSSQSQFLFIEGGVPIISRVMKNGNPVMCPKETYGPLIDGKRQYCQLRFCGLEAVSMYLVHHHTEINAARLASFTHSGLEIENYKYVCIYSYKSRCYCKMQNSVSYLNFTKISFIQARKLSII